MKLKRKKMTKEGIFGLVVLIFALTAPLYITKAYNVHLLVLCAIYVGLASSLNLILGYAGLFSLAHAAFFGMGAYTSAILVGKLGLPIWVGFACSGFIAAVFGLLIAYPSLKLRGDYLAIVTLGFGQIVRLFELNEQWLTNGAMGITAIPKPTLHLCLFRAAAGAGPGRAMGGAVVCGAVPRAGGQPGYGAAADDAVRRQRSGLDAPVGAVAAAGRNARRRGVHGAERALPAAVRLVLLRRGGAAGAERGILRALCAAGPAGGLCGADHPGGQKRLCPGAGHAG